MTTLEACAKYSELGPNSSSKIKYFNAKNNSIKISMSNKREITFLGRKMTKSNQIKTVSMKLCIS